MINSVQNNNYINIINEFRSLIDFINYNDILIEKMFQILEEHFVFDAAGIFFNTPDNMETNVLELYLKNISINKQVIEEKPKIVSPYTNIKNNAATTLDLTNILRFSFLSIISFYLYFFLSVFLFIWRTCP